jgi:hypothetical protein
MTVMKVVQNAMTVKLAARAYYVRVWMKLINLFFSEESSLAQTVSQEPFLGSILSSLEKSILSCIVQVLL